MIGQMQKYMHLKVDRTRSRTVSKERPFYWAKWITYNISMRNLTTSV